MRSSYQAFLWPGLILGWERAAVAGNTWSNGLVKLSFPRPRVFWSKEFVRSLPDIWYKDAEGKETKEPGLRCWMMSFHCYPVCCEEYISLFADAVPLADQRTPLKMYGDWFKAFRKENLSCQDGSEGCRQIGPSWAYWVVTVTSMVASHF